MCSYNLLPAETAKNKWIFYVTLTLYFSVQRLLIFTGVPVKGTGCNGWNVVIAIYMRRGCIKEFLEEKENTEIMAETEFEPELSYPSQQLFI